MTTLTKRQLKNLLIMYDSNFNWYKYKLPTTYIMEGMYRKEGMYTGDI